MKTIHIRFAAGCAALILAGSVATVAPAATGTLRIVSYNIDSQDQNSDNNITQSTGATAHSIPTVIQAIGNHYIGSNAQPVDVLGLEEMLTSTTGGLNKTLNDLTTQLNNIYGAGTYGFDTANQTQSEGLIYDTKTVQIVSVRVLPTGSNVLLQSNGTYTAAHFVSSSETVPRAPMLYQLRPVGYGSNADYYMYVSHARSTSDNSSGDARYMEAQEVRSDAKYNLPAGAHILYSGDWNLFNGSGENAYKCLTGQATSDSINWADSSAVWANSKATQGFDPTSKTSPATTTTWSNSSSDGAASYLYTDSTDAGTFANSSRIDIQLVNSPMLTQAGLQLAPDTLDPHDARNFPSSQYPYAFETFGNNGSTPRGGTATNASNNSLQDLANASTVLADIQLTGSGSSFTGSDHYPIVGDYVLSGVSPLGITWTGGGSTNNWSMAANWTSAPSNGSSLTFAGTTRLSNTNDALTSVGAITFDNTAGAFTLSGNALTIAGDITNNSTNTQTIGLNLTLSAAQQFNAASGNLTLNGTVNNGGNALTVTGSSNTTLAGNVSGAGALVKSGAGTQTLSGNNSYGGGTTVSAGSLVVANVHALGAGGLTINGTASTRLQADLTAPVQLPSLTLAGGTAPTSTLDITNNNVIVHNGNLGTLSAQVKSGLYGAGNWTGAGITSSTAANDGSGATAVGIISNNDGSGGAIYSTWPVGADSGSAVTVTNTDVLLKYTYFGDADLNGSVDASTDYSLWASGFSSGGSLGGWLFGDFDYNGTVDNSTDYSLWATGFAASGTQGPLGINVQPVPEPCTLALGALGLVGLAVSRSLQQNRARA